MTINIEDNVVVPPRTARRTKYPIDDLQVGQSFFVEAEPGEGEQVTEALTRLQSVLHSCARAAARRREGAEFTTRRWDQDGKPGIRLWRTA